MQTAPRKLTLEKPKWGELGLDEALRVLKKHLQTAVSIELYTIPLYLFAAYSIKNQPEVVWEIFS